MPLRARTLARRASVRLLIVRHELPRVSVSLPNDRTPHDQNVLTCKHVRSKLADVYVRMLPSRSVFVWPVFPPFVLACSPAVHHRVDSLSRGFSLCIYMCSTLCMHRMYAVAVLCMLPRARVRMLARCSLTHACPLLNAWVSSMAVRCQVRACLTTNCCILLVNARTCAGMLGAGMHHMFVAIALCLLVPGPPVARARMLEHRSSLCTRSPLGARCCRRKGICAISPYECRQCQDSSVL